jgi:hypothetical protein
MIYIMDVNKFKASDCAYHINKDICSPDALIKRIYEAVKSSAGPGDIPTGSGLSVKKMVKNLCKYMKVSSEIQVLRKAQRMFAEMQSDIDEVIRDRFAPYMEPCDQTAEDCPWLSNNELDLAGESFEKKYKDHKALGFHMINFDERQTALGEITFEDLCNNKCKTMSCVLNTDRYGGPGKHWLCVFLDARKPTVSVEFFNSSGNPPAKSLSYWVERMASEAEACGRRAIRVFNGAEANNSISIGKAHQRKNSECGVYSIYYIWSRLKGIPYSEFTKKVIPDEVMKKFRAKIFRDVE